MGKNTKRAKQMAINLGITLGSEVIVALVRRLIRWIKRS